MKNGRIFVDCFSSLDDIPSKKRGDPIVVLRALDQAKRFSCFEVDRKLASALKAIERRNLATFDTRTIGYPWTRVVVTAAGRVILDETPA